MKNGVRIVTSLRRKIDNMDSVVLFSGGLDSITCLGLAVEKSNKVHAITFDYGQTNNKEIEVAKDAFRYYKNKYPDVMGEHKIFEIDLTQIGGSALTDDDIEILDPEDEDEDIPATYVPGRNTIFLSIGMAYAETKGADSLYIGTNHLDYCFSGENNVMTKSGIKKVRNLEVGELVSSINTEGKQEWKRVLWKEKRNTQNILRIKLENGYEVKVTPDHDMIRLNLDATRGTHELTDIEEINAKRLQRNDYIGVPTTGVNNEGLNDDIDLYNYLKEYSHVEGNKVHKDDEKIWFRKDNKHNRYVSELDFLKICAWYATEGSDRYKRKDTQYSRHFARIYQNQGKNHNDIINLLEAQGITPRTHKMEIHISGPFVAALFDEAYDDEKHLPQHLLDKANNKQLQEILDILVKGDGHSSKSGAVAFFQNEGKLFDQVDYILNRLGIPHKFYMNDKNKRVSWYPNVKEPHMTFNDIKAYKIDEIIEEGKSDDLYDFEVEDNHTVAVGTRGLLYTGQSGYVDCRPEYIDAMQNAFSLATKQAVKEKPIRIRNPIQFLTKEKIIERGLELDVPYEHSWSCYRESEKACGTCDSCKLRLEAFENIKSEDPIEYE